MSDDSYFQKLSNFLSDQWLPSVKTVQDNAGCFEIGFLNEQLLTEKVLIALGARRPVHQRAASTSQSRRQQTFLRLRQNEYSSHFCKHFDYMERLACRHSAAGHSPRSPPFSLGLFVHRWIAFLNLSTFLGFAATFGNIISARPTCTLCIVGYSC